MSLIFRLLITTLLISLRVLMSLNLPGFSEFDNWCEAFSKNLSYGKPELAAAEL